MEQVIESKDKKLQDLNTPVDAQISTGEIHKSEVSKPITKELEIGKKFPTSGTIAKRPEEMKSIDGSTGQIEKPHTTGRTAGKTLGNSEKLVRVWVMKYQKCKIGPTWYEFHPKTSYNVPETVKEVLKRAKALGVE